MKTANAKYATRYLGSNDRKDLPEDLQGPLAGISDQTLPVASFPYGTQVCEVEVDPETGEVQIVRYTAVDDVGRAVNPLILHGQTHASSSRWSRQASTARPSSGAPDCRFMR